MKKKNFPKRLARPKQDTTSRKNSFWHLRFWLEESSSKINEDARQKNFKGRFLDLEKFLQKLFLCDFFFPLSKGLLS